MRSQFISLSLTLSAHTSLLLLFLLFLLLFLLAPLPPPLPSRPLPPPASVLPFASSWPLPSPHMLPPPFPTPKGSFLTLSAPLVHSPRLSTSPLSPPYVPLHQLTLYPLPFTCPHLSHSPTSSLAWWRETFVQPLVFSIK